MHVGGRERALPPSNLSHFLRSCARAPVLHHTLAFGAALPPSPQSLLESTQSDPRFMALPGAAASLESLHSAITATLSDALLAKVGRAGREKGQGLEVWGNTWASSNL